MSKKPTGTAAGNSEAMRIYERMEEERLRKLQAKAEANKREGSGAFSIGTIMGSPQSGCERLDDAPLAVRSPRLA